ncbi:Ccch zinc finger protein [Neofusicoccum parvum]|nr:Ccch zinc finger protein [Neofusicoccum parvum]
MFANGPSYNMNALPAGGDVHEDSEEDDADEEAKFKAANGVIQIDYKGQSSTLKSAEEIAAWIEERKKRFPTKERIAQKQKEEDVRRRAREQAEVERKSKYPQQERQPKKRKHKDADEQDRAIKKAEKLREKLRKAEKQIEKARANTTPKTVSEAVPNKALGINYDSDESTGQGNDDGSGSLAESSSEVSTDSDSEDSSSDDESDDDAPPEEESSEKRPLRVHLPNRKAIQTATPRARREKEINTPKRTTLRERMVEQERREEAELALRAIKFLGENGVLG